MLRHVGFAHDRRVLVGVASERLELADVGGPPMRAVAQALDVEPEAHHGATPRDRIGRADVQHRDVTVEMTAHLLEEPLNASRVERAR